MERPPFTVQTRTGRLATIREAAARDYDGYLAAIRRVSAEPARTLVVQEPELWSAERFAANLIPWGPDGVRLVVEMEGAIGGGFSIHRRGMLANRHVAEFGIFLVDAFRGAGIGRRLLEICEIWARIHGVLRIEMPVFAHNERAQRLYRSMGYEIEGYERRAIRFPEGFVDEIRMAKLL